MVFRVVVVHVAAGSWLVCMLLLVGVILGRVIDFGPVEGVGTTISAPRWVGRTPSIINMYGAMGHHHQSWGSRALVARAGSIIRILCEPASPTHLRSRLAMGVGVPWCASISVGRTKVWDPVFGTGYVMTHFGGNRTSFWIKEMAILLLAVKMFSPMVACANVHGLNESVTRVSPEFNESQT